MPIKYPKRTMILLAAETHKQLKHLAVEQETSLAFLIRDAVAGMLSEDRDDMHAAERVLRTFKPGTGVSYEAYRRSRKRSPLHRIS